MCDALEELKSLSAIAVRAQTQEHLEKQALEALQTFVSNEIEPKIEIVPKIETESNIEVRQKDNDVEEGEISLDDEPAHKLQPKRKEKPFAQLNLNDYLKRQEELKQSWSKRTNFENVTKKIEPAKRIKKGQKRKRCETIVSSQSRYQETIVKDTAIKDESEEILNEEINEVKVENMQGVKSPCNDNNGNEILEDEAAVKRIKDDAEASGSEYYPSDDDYYSDEDFEYKPTKSHEKAVQKSLQPKVKKHFSSKYTQSINDDGSIKNFKTRLENYRKECKNERDLDAIEIDKKFKVPLQKWNRLYGYQQDGVKWLWNLHCQSTGGLLGDEMGLGKTVQVIMFLHALQYSQIKSKHGKFIGVGPTLIVCPATVMYQWVQHFHTWAPEFRVAVLHKSGSYTGKAYDFLLDLTKSNGIIITGYTGLLKYKEIFKNFRWHYLILDEGHKIKNSEAKVTLAAKEFKTPHRLLLTGSPMQNNLQELWSVFDFISPGLLGTLNVFQEHFANPIIQGGYVNASPLQEATALTMASTLKNIISPYMLRRMKSEVQHLIYLPNKTEQVLFCSLTQEQTDLYKEYLLSEQTSLILGREGKNYMSHNQMRANVLVGITALRKICNHPDLYLTEMDGSAFAVGSGDKFGCYKRSGKMVVVSALLKIWKRQGHRALLFCQGRCVLKLFVVFFMAHKWKIAPPLRDFSSPYSKYNLLIF